VKTLLQVLSNDERERVHEHTLALLEDGGVRVDSEQARAILRAAGAAVDDRHVARLPRTLVEGALEAAPKRFSLGGRRPGWSLPMNEGGFTLLADGGGTSVVDRASGARRPGTRRDWVEATTLLDALDDVGLYWWMVEYGPETETPVGLVAYLRDLFGLYSKHIQDSFLQPALAPWLLEALEIVFGGRDAVRAAHPYSYLMTPTSPLVLERSCIDTWLALRGYDIPVAIMPMPLMGATAPASMTATLVVANAETLATLCVVQAAEPGTPTIYAPVQAAIDPRSGRLAGGGIEHAIMAAAGTQMARLYGLPVEASGCGTDQFVPGAQAAFEKATTALFTALALPDILVGPGMLAGAMVLSLEELLIDCEILRVARKAQDGVTVDDESWLTAELAAVGPGGDFLGQASTRRNARSGEFYLPGLGLHDTYESWLAAGAPDIVDEARAKAEALLATHAPLPLDDDTTRALDELAVRAARAQ
jgi:trimethylamine---corrinoid protein Co-methyltransferase